MNHRLPTINCSITINGKIYQTNLSRPIDISIPLKDGLENPNCFYAPPVEISPVVAGDFVGSTRQGGLVNFMNVKFNPHGNGTHTECVGHIAKEIHTIHQSLRQFFFLAKVITLYPQKQANGDRIIVKKQLMDIVEKGEVTAIVLRTQPNDDTKLTRQYSGTNPPYIHHEAVAYLVECGIQHFLLDLPSLDREEDDGKLLAHKAFWQYPDAPRTDCTITEMVYIPDAVKDGFYLLNLQIASLELDASPSKPVLYRLT